MPKPRLLVCGIGSKQFLDNYLALLKTHPLAPILIAGTEIKSRVKYATQKLKKNGIHGVEILAISPFCCDGKIKKEDKQALNSLVKRLEINGIIVITEAIAHLSYLKWGAQIGIPCLVEKPLTSYNGITHELSKAKQILKDYEALKVSCEQKESFISIVSQRRWNKAFLFIKERIEEIFQKYEVPVSLMRGMKNKGDWMGPKQLISKENHPYKYSYGVLSHTGYHPIDIMDYTTSKIFSSLNVNRLEVFGQMSFPKDIFFATKKAKIFKENPNRYGLKELGECSVNGVYTYFKDLVKVCLVNIQISNNGICQKDFKKPEGCIWEQTPGTIRQEAYTWTQGPFQEIDFEIYQDKSGRHSSIYEYGGDNYGLITIKKNGKKRNVEKISLEEFEIEGERVAEACLKEALLEFIDRIDGKKVTPRSDL